MGMGPSPPSVTPLVLQDVFHPPFYTLSSALYLLDLNQFLDKFNYAHIFDDDSPHLSTLSIPSL
ncbi:hypothetical protein DXG01_011447 [Tephrocybe rancida]|nr:hypothetical protein DXG01_011447 [Tephrocybe rancida]